MTQIGPPTEAAWLAADGSFVLALHRWVLSTLEPPRGGLYEHGWRASGGSAWVLGREALELFDARGRRREQVAVDALRLYPWHDALVGDPEQGRPAAHDAARRRSSHSRRPTTTANAV